MNPSKEEQLEELRKKIGAMNSSSLMWVLVNVTEELARRDLAE